MISPTAELREMWGSWENHRITLKYLSKALKYPWNGLKYPWKLSNHSKVFVESSKIQKSRNPLDSQAFSQDFNFFFFQFSKSNDLTIGFLDFWIYIYIFFYYSSMILLSNDVFTRSEVGTGWKYWFHFGLRDGVWGLQPRPWLERSDPILLNR